jgi:uncharacterized protein (DUF1697 family)
MTHIALFRGINIGGRNILPMAELTQMAEAAGYGTFRTYIQSGNAVFEAPAAKAADFAGKMAAAIEKARGFRPDILVMSAAALEKAAKANPFPEGEAEPKTLHLYFLTRPAEKPRLEKMEELCSETERFRLSGAVFYLHAPDGIGRSKLAAKAEALLGVPVTARNWATVTRLREMAEGQG